MFSFNLPSCKSLDICLILDIYRHIETAELGVRMSLTNRDISQLSLCHLSLGSSMVRASHWRSEGCGFDSRLGLRNIFWVCESLSSQKCFSSSISLALWRLCFPVFEESSLALNCSCLPRLCLRILEVVV